MSDFRAALERILTAYDDWAGAYGLEHSQQACDALGKVMDDAKALLARTEPDIPAVNPIAHVINNNRPGWTNIIETAPNVTLDVGSPLYDRSAVQRLAAALAGAIHRREDVESAAAEKARPEPEPKPEPHAGGGSMIKWYGQGMKMSFHACQESNTGAPESLYRTVSEVPAWVSSRVAIGQEITVKNIRGEIHWYIDNVEVTEPQSPDPEQP